jgi:hypothetical protein
MRRKVYRVGGAKIGSARASHPFAVLTCSSNKLTIEIMILGTYNFNREQVVAIHKHTPGFFPGRGICIEHIVPEYPEDIMFFAAFENLTLLIEDIQNSGFIPRARKS